jgi:hypothetical protein
MQFKVEWDFKGYENKVETIEGIHSLNLLNENNLEGAPKPSQKNHLSIDGACVGMSTWKNQKKTWGFGLAHNLFKNVRSSHLI